MISNYPKDFLDLLNSISSKRPRTVIQHILQHGFITSQELKDTYGYNHPPRAIRDVREHGIPIITYRTKGIDGRKIAAYKFGDPAEAKNLTAKSAGRTVLSKTLKKALIEKYGAKCFVYYEAMDEDLLQVDHRIPYEIAGEQYDQSIEIYMLLSLPSNRAKSWTCEHCKNWTEKDPSFCAKCFWAYPESYEHIAGKQQKIVPVVFTGDEIKDYCKLIEMSGIEKAGQTIKRIVHEYLK